MATGGAPPFTNVGRDAVYVVSDGAGKGLLEDGEVRRGFGEVS